MKIRQNTSGNSPITFVTHERFVIPFFLPSCCVNSLLGSLSNNVFERRTSTGSGLFSFFDGGFAQILSQIASITVKKLRNTNFISSRHVKRENTSLPVDVRRSKTSLLKLPINSLRSLGYKAHFLDLGTCQITTFVYNTFRVVLWFGLFLRLHQALYH